MRWVLWNLRLTRMDWHHHVCMVVVGWAWVTTRNQMAKWAFVISGNQKLWCPLALATGERVRRGETELRLPGKEERFHLL